jgi:hypothetical protein
MDVKSELNTAVIYARKTPAAPVRRSGFRAFEAMLASARTSTFTLIKRLQIVESSALPPHKFELSLNVAVAFGDRKDWELLGHFPRQRDHNPNIIVGQTTAHFGKEIGLAAGRPAWLSRARAAVAECESPARSVEAFAALTRNDQTQFIDAPPMR